MTYGFCAVRYSKCLWSRTHAGGRRADREANAIGANDVRRLFLAATTFDRPGFCAVQTSGDLGECSASNRRAAELFGWRPQEN